MKYVVGSCLSCQCMQNPIYVCKSTMKRHFFPHKKPLFPGVIFGQILCINEYIFSSFSYFLGKTADFSPRQSFDFELNCDFDFKWMDKA